MHMPSLTVFANIRINDEERFIRMKDSFMSFRGISAEKWVINVRGVYKQDTIIFLKEHLGDKLSPHILESGKGWFHDSRQLIGEIKTDFVMVWVEDHINLRDVAIYSNIIEEMFENGSEYLNYTWWFLGQTRRVYDGIEKRECKFIDTFELDKHKAKNLNFNGNKPFLISLPSIFSKELFLKIINKDDPKLRRWPKDTPFDFEKSGEDFHWLPMRMAIAKDELFACIDDDQNIPGYSLQSRGLYPSRISRFKQNTSEKNMVGKLLSKMIPGAVRHYIKRLSYHI